MWNSESKRPSHENCLKNTVIRRVSYIFPPRLVVRYLYSSGSLPIFQGWGEVGLQVSGRDTG